MGTNVEQWRSLTAAHFGGNTDAALRVMRCESGGNPSARNSSSGAAGLFQFMPFWWEGKWDPYDAGRNIAEAASLSRAGSDWSHWSCKP
jgi:soluble lytic murein transglycosylase-like protein